MYYLLRPPEERENVIIYMYIVYTPYDDCGSLHPHQILHMYTCIYWPGALTLRCIMSVVNVIKVFFSSTWELDTVNIERY